MDVDATAARDRLLSPAALTVAGSTVVLTAAFVGVAALFTDELVSGLTGRIPYYVFVFAVGFLGALWKLDDRSRDGLTVLIASLGIALGAGLLVGFAVEGLRYAVEHPGNVIERQLVVYFGAAGIICTALGVWVVRHWREFATTTASTPAADLE